MAGKRKSRLVFGLITVALIGGGGAWAFWPRPMLVDLGQVARGAMMVTIDDEGRTEVHDTYVVSAPASGRVLRSALEVGDPVTKGETVVARMLPASPEALDARTEEQARALVAAAEAALTLARAELERAEADRDLTEGAFLRAKRLFENDIVSRAALDEAERADRAAAAALETAAAAIAMREAELENAKARLISFDDTDEGGATGGTPATEDQAVALHAPADGIVLQIYQTSETTVAVGTPLVELGDITADLEVQVDLLSRDAVRISAGQRVLIDNWGGDAVLNGVVRRIAPWGVTKVSALGVEEQRVSVAIDFTDPPEARAGLGHGYRVDVQIVTWESADALKVPTSALFREGADWAIFTVTDGIAQQKVVQIGANNGVEAEVTGGLAEGDVIVLYPPAELVGGQEVAQRQVE